MLNKRFLAIATAACTLAGSSLTAFAAPANMGQMPQGGPGGPGQMMQENGQEPPALPEGVEEGERPELPEGVEEGDMPELPEGMEEGNMGMRPGMEQGDGSDLYDKLMEQVSSIEDEDTKSNLETLIGVFTAALDAERDALDSGEATEEELETLKAAVDSAKADLDAAMSEAGITMPERNEDPAFDEQKNMSSGEIPTFAPNSDNDSASDESSTDSTAKTGFFSKIGSAIGGFFNKLFNK